MFVRRLALKDFGTLEDAEFQFVPGVNVLLGANGTGKTHSMKALYAVLRAAPQNGSALALKDRLTEKFSRVFVPANARIGRLTKRRTGQRSAKVQVEATDGDELRFSIYSKDDSIRVTRRGLATTPPSIFLPSRELLAMYEGFVAAYLARELSFDETYHDGCVALSAGALRGPRPKVITKALENLQKLHGGRVVEKGGRFYVGHLEAHLVAEGHRKLASITRLLANGELAPGRVLLWDEPEANLNPSLIAGLADLIVELSRAGVQIICASHDYLFTQTLALHESDSFPIRYFGFSKQRGTTTVEAADSLGELSENLIQDAFLSHFDRRRRA